MKKIMIALIGSILLVALVAGCGEKEVEPPEIECPEKETEQYEIEVVPYDPSQITEDMVTPVYYTMAFTEEEKAELEEQGFDCVPWEILGPGGYEDGVHYIGEIVDSFWLCDKEREELNVIVIELLDGSGSFPGVERCLDGPRLLSESTAQYQVLIAQAGRLEWFYGYEMEEGNFVDLYDQGFYHKYHYSPLKVYSSGGERNKGHIGGLVVYEGEIVTFEVFHQVYSIRHWGDEEILSWAALAQKYWLSVIIHPVLEESKW